MVAAEVAGSSERGLEVLEAALQAWTACEPRGYTLKEAALEPQLHAVAFRVPGSATSPQKADLVIDLFVPAASEDGCSLFVKMLKARHGEVHFLYFWRSFSEVARILANMDRAAAAEPAAAQRTLGEALSDELELLRDTLLRNLETGEEDDLPQEIAARGVLDAIREAGEMSCAPKFWSSVEKGLLTGQRDASCTFSLDDLAAMLLRWLHEAVTWAAAEQSFLYPRPPSPKPKKEEAGMPVLLHIYDVSHEDDIHNLNKMLAHKRSPLKLGGIFHAGVEVDGLEWSFAMSPEETIPGIACSLPRQHPEHRYRQTVRLRNTKMSGEQIAALLSVLIEEYPGDDYDLLRRNCCHFANDFSKRLGSGRIPGWVHRLAKVGALVDGALQCVTNRGLLSDPGSEL